MSVIAATITSLPNKVTLAQWALVTENDTCSPVEYAASADRSVQIAGTFGASTVLIAGSNDGTNYVTLTDPQGNAVSKTTAAIETLEEVTRYIKPTMSGGTGQSLTISLLLRRP